MVTVKVLEKQIVLICLVHHDDICGILYSQLELQNNKLSFYRFSVYRLLMLHLSITKFVFLLVIMNVLFINFY